MDVHLKVLHGKPRGHCLRFGPGEFVFGRGPECHVRPNSELVSRQHCMLKVLSDGALSIRDLGSANGTLVNGARLLGERPLQIGDTLQVGPVVLQVVRPPTVPGPSAPDTMRKPNPAASETAVLDLNETCADTPSLPS
jgi:pSer/pThr/pTyr-binding forkhead associated (FHA) protein